MIDNRKLVTVVIGTRPEAIKLSPVILAMRDHPRLRCRVVLTGQHRDLAEPVLRDFGIAADIRFALECDDGPSMTSTMAAILTGMDVELGDNPPAMVLVQGDTTSTLAGALAAFHRRVPVGHVEAGLRSGDMGCPWPEEGNRRMVAQIAAVHFAPTDDAWNNLLMEEKQSSVFMVGNTVADAVRIAGDIDVERGHVPFVIPFGFNRMALVTCHRRESIYDGLERICQAVAKLAQLFPDVLFFWPVHPNPSTSSFTRYQFRKGHPGNLVLGEPVTSYPTFVSMLERADLILTDSGGIQEEACILGKPTVVMRDVTDRPETLGRLCVLSGTDRESIIEDASEMLNDPPKSEPNPHPYGDGHTAERIVGIVDRFLEDGK